MQYVISNAARRPLTTRLRVKNGPEVRSSAAFVAQMVLAQASSWPSGLVPAHAGKLTCAESEVNPFLFFMTILSTPSLYMYLYDPPIPSSAIYIRPHDDAITSAKPRCNELYPLQ